ncbi:MAG: glycosyltransferase family 1 protein [Bacteroidota bacterium]|jgi:glycosyltransferase involved in cell wall biosynthesis
MKVAILADSIDKRVIKGGEAVYTFNLIKGLSDKKIDVTLLYTDLPAISSYENFKKVSYRIMGMPLINYSIKNKLINYSARKYDVLHATTNYGMPAGKSRAKKIITLHDVGPLVYPHFYHPYTVNKFIHEIPQILKNVDAIITVSIFQKNEIIKYYKYLNEKIYVIYPGVDTNIFQKTDKPRLIPEDYILLSGGLNPRKGLNYIIDAIQLLGNKIPHKVYTIGDPNRENNEVRSKIDKYKLKDRIIIKEYVDTCEDLVNLYSYASLFVYPSLYEGFGLPPLEAMACGCPVITSNNTSLTEIYTGTTLTIDPSDTIDLSNKIYDVLTNKTLRDDLMSKGYKFINQFKWEYNVEKTINLYNDLLC